MKEHPLLMSTEMVQATLQERKTNTRRLTGLNHININPGSWNFQEFAENEAGELLAFFSSNSPTRAGYVHVKFPYGNIMDLLWVRESWCMYPHAGNDGAAGLIFKADHPNLKWKWKPSIHLPKNESRIWLEITDIKVERLQDISEEDAKAEGAKKVWEDEKGIFWFPKSESIRVVGEHGDYKTGFKCIWTSINGEGSWNANPWIWVIAFKVLSTTGRPTQLSSKNIPQTI